MVPQPSPLEPAELGAWSDASAIGWARSIVEEAALAVRPDSLGRLLASLDEDWLEGAVRKALAGDPILTVRFLRAARTSPAYEAPPRHLGEIFALAPEAALRETVERVAREVLAQAPVADPRNLGMLARHALATTSVVEMRAGALTLGLIETSPQDLTLAAMLHVVPAALLMEVRGTIVEAVQARARGDLVAWDQAFFDQTGVSYGALSAAILEELGCGESVARWVGALNDGSRSAKDLPTEANDVRAAHRALVGMRIAKVLATQAGFPEGLGVPWSVDAATLSAHGLAPFELSLLVEAAMRRVMESEHDRRAD